MARELELRLFLWCWRDVYIVLAHSAHMPKSTHALLSFFAHHQCGRHGYGDQRTLGCSAKGAAGSKTEARKQRQYKYVQVLLMLAYILAAFLVQT